MAADRPSTVALRNRSTSSRSVPCDAARDGDDPYCTRTHSGLVRMPTARETALRAVLPRNPLQAFLSGFLPGLVGAIRPLMRTVSSSLFTVGYVLGSVWELTRYALRFGWALAPLSTASGTGLWMSHRNVTHTASRPRPRASYRQGRANAFLREWCDLESRRPDLPSESSECEGLRSRPMSFCGLHMLMGCSEFVTRGGADMKGLGDS